MITTVNDLIEALMQQDGNAPVFVKNDEFCSVTPLAVTVDGDWIVIHEVYG